MRLIGNALGFQAVWLAAVAGAGAGFWWPGPLCALLFALWQLRVVPHPGVDLRLAALAIMVGGLADTALLQLGLIRFASPFPSPEFAPVWILALWAGFALTLNHSLARLKQHLLLAALLGALGGPFAYAIAQGAWHAASFPAGWQPWIAIAGTWALLTPILLHLAVRLSAAKQQPEAVDAPA